MPGRDFRNLEDRAISVLATTFVLAAGVVVSLFMCVLFAEDPKEPALFAAAVFGTTAWLLYCLRDRPECSGSRQASSLVRRLLGRRNKPTTIRYRPRIKRADVRCVRYGTNQPPSVETIRDLTDGMRTWVPSRVPPRRRQEPDG